jgi:hypothetical protein
MPQALGTQTQPQTQTNGRNNAYMTQALRLTGRGNANRGSGSGMELALRPVVGRLNVNMPQANKNLQRSKVPKGAPKGPLTERRYNTLGRTRGAQQQKKLLAGSIESTVPRESRERRVRAGKAVLQGIQNNSKKNAAKKKGP